VNLAFVEEGIVERLVAEGARSPADLVMTVGHRQPPAGGRGGRAPAVESEVLEAAIPANLRSPDDLWFALTERARIVYASKDRVAEGEVTTYEDLADPKWQGRICSRSGVHNYSLALLAAVIAHHGEEYAKEWAEGLKANLAVKPQGGDRDQVRSIWAGECDISLGNTYYMGQMLEDPEQQEWAESVRIEFPVFEDGGTHVNVSGIGMTQAAPNREEALQLMEWLVSPQAQAIYAEENHEYPVVPGSEVSELVAGWGEMTPDTVDLTEVAGHRAAALRIMEEVNFDG
jgi:iron(III) transport system substrate-binding protein